MNRITQRALAAALGLALAGGIGWGTMAVWSGASVPGVRDGRLEAAGEEREAAVLAELADLPDHPWAGTYRTAGRYTTTLVIAPRAGFAVHKSTGCGNCSGWYATGDVLEAGEARATIEVELGCDDSNRDVPAYWWCRDEAVHFVRWGALLFAIPESRLERFYLRANDGFRFPEEAWRGEAEGDPEHPARPEALPEVVPGYAHLVLARPLHGRVLALAEWRARKRDDPDAVQYHDAVYTVDLGAADGLAPGHRLFFEGDVPWRPDRSAEVIEVDAQSARVMLLTSEPREAAERVVGVEVDTRHPDAPR